MAKTSASLRSMKFDHVEASDDAAFKLAGVWFGELSGSAESRFAQLAARRCLAALIRARMEGPPDKHDMEEVARDAHRAECVADNSVGDDLGLKTIVMNLTESRAAIYSLTWWRTAGRLGG